jgi:serine/threonine protein phosphatase PrpC
LFHHPQFPADIRIAVAETVARLEFESRCRKDIDTRFSGSTLCLAIIRESSILCANLGDSRIVLGVRDANGLMIAQALSQDHKPDVGTELHRIQCHGGRVYRTISQVDRKWGPSRVWLPHIEAPGLAMSRSLCDDIIHTSGVTSMIDFHDHVIDYNKDCVLLVATDGLWEYVSNQEAVDMAMEHAEPDQASIR